MSVGLWEIVCGTLAGVAAYIMIQEWVGGAQWLTMRLIEKAVSKLPAQSQERYREEWYAHVSDLPTPLSKLFSAITIYARSGRMHLSLPATEGSMKARMTHHRVFDLIIAVCGLAVFSVLFLLVAIAVRLTSRGPVFYSHARLGRDSELFGCLKLRTHVVNGDEVLREHLSTNPEAAKEWRETRKLRKDPRVTKVGALLRTTSLDELPQLVNILRGSMSVVGPRPVTSDELALYGPYSKDYLAVRPGLTGLWQIQRRRSWSHRRLAAAERLFRRRRSWRLYILIVLRTVPATLSRRGNDEKEPRDR